MNYPPSNSGGFRGYSTWNAKQIPPTPAQKALVRPFQSIVAAKPFPAQVSRPKRKCG